MNIYRSSGQYIGFVNQNNIFSWDGKYLGWLDNQNYAWDKSGNFAGQLFAQNGYNYILRNSFGIPPVSKTPKQVPNTPEVPTPSGPASIFQLPIGLEDAF